MKKNSTTNIASDVRIVINRYIIIFIMWRVYVSCTELGQIIMKKKNTVTIEPDKTLSVNTICMYYYMSIYK